jgi:hypothetical protein
VTVSAELTSICMCLNNIGLTNQALLNDRYGLVRISYLEEKQCGRSYHYYHSTLALCGDPSMCVVPG